MWIGASVTAVVGICLWLWITAQKRTNPREEQDPEPDYRAACPICFADYIPEGRWGGTPDCRCTVPSGIKVVYHRGPEWECYCDAEDENEEPRVFTQEEIVAHLALHREAVLILEEGTRIQEVEIDGRSVAVYGLNGRFTKEEAAPVAYEEEQLLLGVTALIQGVGMIIAAYRDDLKQAERANISLLSQNLIDQEIRNQDKRLRDLERVLPPDSPFRSPGETPLLQG